MKTIITFFLFWAAGVALHAQQISNMQTRFTGSNVEVTFTLATNEPEDIDLLYSTNNGNTYQICPAVTGDLKSQTSGNKKIVWDCVEDGVFTADVILKIDFKIKIEMVFVEGGTFTMGCTSEQGNDCYGWEKPAHPVSLSDFYIGKYEVTQAQWKAVMGHNPSNFKGDNLPVENVSWDDAQEFIRNLNAQTGKQYRLPTEAEWEYACRGGARSAQYKYSGSNTVGNVAWYDGNSGRATHAVGSKSPNELGIYDMSGNVWEWCSDWDGNYSSSAQTNPQGPSSGSYRVGRGGGWGSNARYVRVSDRSNDTPGNRYNYIGFRLACSSK